MKKVLFLITLFILTAANNGLTEAGADMAAPVATVAHNSYDGTDMPLGEGEEKSSEEDKDITEDDDEASLHHGWLSRGKSNLTDLHILYQGILFQDLELEVVVPPPKG